MYEESVLMNIITLTNVSVLLHSIHKKPSTMSTNPLSIKFFPEKYISVDCV